MKERDWKVTVEDVEEKRVFEGLADERWDWRTVRGLTKALSLDETTVRRTLERYPGLVQRSSATTAQGEELYTLKERYYGRKGALEKGWDFLSPPSSSSASK